MDDKKIQLLENRVSKLEKLIIHLQSQLTYTQKRLVRTDESVRHAHNFITTLKRK